jgi:hypothetical protein
MSYTVVPMRLEEHREALLRLWQENSFDPRANDCAAERFAWLYQDSAANDAATWLAVEQETGTVVGCASVFRSDRHVGGRVVGAGVPAVFFVGRRHRVAAAALGAQRALVAGGCAMGLDVFVGKPNRSAHAVCARVGYQTVGALHDWVRVVWGDNSLSNLRPGGDGDADDVLSAADGRFDDLWHRAKDRFPMIAVKTSAFLNWRYGGFRENYRFYCLERRDSRRLLGYIVFYAMKDGVVITDLFCEEPSGPILENLLFGFCARMKMEGHLWVSVWYAGPASFEDCLVRAGYRRGKHERALMAYVNPDAAAAFRARIADRDNWFIFGGEMDVLLSDEVWRDRGDRSAHTASSEPVATE